MRVAVAICGLSGFLKRQKFGNHRVPRWPDCLPVGPWEYVASYGSAMSVHFWRWGYWNLKIRIGSRVVADELQFGVHMLKVSRLSCIFRTHAVTKMD